MALDLNNPELQFALEAVRHGALLGRRIRAGMEVLNLTKSDLSPVTVADFAIQAMTARSLERDYPKDVLVAEEDSKTLRESGEVLQAVCGYLSEEIPDADGERVCDWIDRGTAQPGGRFWVLDPIDGTKGYLRGGQYAVALALVVDGTVQLGALGCPALDPGCRAEAGQGVITVAVRGKGAWRATFDSREFKPLRVSDIENAGHARLLRSYETGHTNVQQLDDLARVLGLAAPPVLMDSQAKFAVLAAGNAEILLRLLSPSQREYREKIWDIAAGAIVIEEAGGRITDIDGKKLDFTAGRKLAHNRGICATNGLLHESVLAALEKIE